MLCMDVGYSWNRGTNIFDILFLHLNQSNTGFDLQLFPCLYGFLKNENLGKILKAKRAKP